MKKHFHFKVHLMSNYSINETQELPQEILDAIIQKKLVIFIGAGASRIIGCKGWDDLSNNLINLCFNTSKKNPLEGSLITFKEKESLTKIGDPKKIITICKKILEKNGFGEKYFQTLEESLNGQKELISLRDIYKEIYKIPAIFVTTNVDTHLHKQFAPSLDLVNVVYKENDFNRSVELSKIYQIHGTILDKDSMVFTVSDYLKRYNGKIKNFLEDIFKNYVVLFIGYGLSEFEVLDFLILKGDPSQKPGVKNRKYVVLPFFSGEENIHEFMDYYYSDLGIEVIPYAIDKNGYNQLYELIKDWNSQIRSKSPIIIDLNKKSDEVLSNFDPQKAAELFGYLRPNSPQEIYFLTQLGKIENPSVWFELLNAQGYFDPKYNPSGIEASRRIWLILIYLENFAKYTVSHPSDEGYQSLLGIIDSIIDYKDASGQRVENDFTEYKIFCIVFSLPSEKISDKYFEYFKDCLVSKNSHTLISSEISQNVLSKFLKKEDRKICLKLLEIVFDFKESSNSDLWRIQSLVFDSAIQEYYYLKYSKNIQMKS
ncbi:MAG: SIR2 family protein [Candidatus Methanomethylophilaceae archaeon]|nr:SIR2 family protein [Candidatus Methanomethylophilaceae archaeon]